jgi:hypothetical protein
MLVLWRPPPAPVEVVVTQVPRCIGSDGLVASPTRDVAGLDERAPRFAQCPVISAVAALDGRGLTVPVPVHVGHRDRVPCWFDVDTPTRFEHPVMAWRGGFLFPGQPSTGQLAHGGPALRRRDEFAFSFRYFHGGDEHVRGTLGLETPFPRLFVVGLTVADGVKCCAGPRLVGLNSCG